MARNADSAVCSRIAPDPCAAVLPALSALAAVASIAAVNWVGEENKLRRPNARRHAPLAVRELETCCLGLAEIFRRLLQLTAELADESSQRTTPLKFGMQLGRITANSAVVYDRLINDIAAMLVLASENAAAVMLGIEEGAFEAPDAVFNAFAECQDELNHLLQSRANLKTCIEKGVEQADRLTALIRELKRHEAR